MEVRLTKRLESKPHGQEQLKNPCIYLVDGSYLAAREHPALFQGKAKRRSSLPSENVRTTRVRRGDLGAWEETRRLWRFTQRKCFQDLESYTCRPSQNKRRVEQRQPPPHRCGMYEQLALSLRTSRRLVSDKKTACSWHATDKLSNTFVSDASIHDPQNTKTRPPPPSTKRAREKNNNIDTYKLRTAFARI